MKAMPRKCDDGHSISKIKVQISGIQQAEQSAPPFLLLDENGMISDCSKSVEERFGYQLIDIAWRHVSCIFPQLSESALIQKGKVNSHFEYIAHCGHVFQGVDKLGGTVPTELKFIRREHEGVVTLRLILHPQARQHHG